MARRTITKYPLPPLPHVWARRRCSLMLLAATFSRSNRGVQWETWLVGLQHRLLLGVTTSPNDGVALSNAKEGAGSDGGGGACACPKASTFPARTTTSGRGDSAAAASAGCAFCPPRRRYLYRLVAGVADFSERVRERVCKHKSQYYWYCL